LYWLFHQLSGQQNGTVLPGHNDAIRLLPPLCVNNPLTLHHHVPIHPGNNAPRSLGAQQTHHPDIPLSQARRILK
jgi:hypothetical protein